MDIKQSNTYTEILEKFGEEAVKSRYCYIKCLLEDFIKRHNFSNSIFVSEHLLDYVVIDYYVDIKRIEDFHNIEYTSDVKIHAYTAHWLLRHKPLQLKNELEGYDACFINEDFVVEYLCSFLFKDPNNIPIVPEKQDSYDLFVKTMRYAFRYRLITAQNIELLLLAFFAGRGYQYSVDFIQ